MVTCLVDPGGIQGSHWRISLQRNTYEQTRGRNITQVAEMNTDLYRCDRIIGHFTVHRMVGYNLGSSTVDVGVSCKLLRNGREDPWPMVWHFPLW